MSKYIESTKDIDFSECGLQALEVAIREEAYPIIERNFEKLAYYWIMCRYIKEFALGDDIMGIYEWFKHSLLDVMINVPSSNATFAYNHMLLVCGSGFLWDDKGRLVHDSQIDEKPDECANKEENKEPYSTKKDHDAFLNLLEKAVTERVPVHLLDRTLTVGDGLEQAYVGSDKAYLLSRNVTELLNEEIHKVFTVKERMDDFTLPYEG